MPVYRKSSGSNVVAAVRRRTAAGTWVVATVRRRTAQGTWVVVSGEHSVAPDNYGANADNGSHQFAISSNVTGGIGPFTYAWSWASGGVGMTISNATSAVCTITSTGTNVYRSGVLRCTVVDTGNGNLSKFGDGNIDVQHGIPQ